MGRIEIFRRDTHKSVGYLTRHYAKSLLTSAAIVMFDPGSGTELTMTCMTCNGNFLGLHAPSDDTTLHAGSSAYVHLFMVSSKKSNLNDQIAVWSFDDLMSELSLSWSNSNGSPSTQQTLILVSDTFVYLTGDVDAVGNDWGASIPIYLVFNPIQTEYS
ncbi:hypothetical protein DL96DRAFT_1717933 [Flagelloscypha sp. PMI_526]|nr:hypothetical protein DL96DRAFT_1717933 [Flagelloscypha sp. PMI_526]